MQIDVKAASRLGWDAASVFARQHNIKPVSSKFPRDRETLQTEPGATKDWPLGQKLFAHHLI